MDPEMNPTLFLPNNPTDELNFDFQSLNLSHKEEIEIDFEHQSQELPPSRFNLLFKVGPPEGKSSRNITQFMFERAMRAAWGTRFYKVESVVDNLFMVYFRSEEDQRWIWQRQPWIAERETLLVEWVDPSKSRPIDSYTFRYLPVNVHLYGIPKHLRSVDLVDKIIGKIGIKDNSVVMTGNAMFRIPEYVIARIILDVTKPLLDSVTINISKERKIKVFIHYEKIVKICTFCGHLFHNVSSCNQRQQIIWKLNPIEAAKVPELIYGIWRTQESEIPAEARPEEIEVISRDPYIQSLKNFFQKGDSSHSNVDTTLGREKGIFSSYSNNLQLVPTTSFNARVTEISGGRNSKDPERQAQNSKQELRSGQGIFPQVTHQVQQGTGIFGQGPPPPTVMSSQFQTQQSQGQVYPWLIQNPFPSNQQWQSQVNPFVLQNADHQNPQSNNQSNGKQNQGMSSSNTQFGSLTSDAPVPTQQTKDQHPAPGDKTSLYSPHATLTRPLPSPHQSFEKISPFQPHAPKPAHGHNYNRNNKRQGSPLHHPPPKKSLSPSHTIKFKCHSPYPYSRYSNPKSSHEFYNVEYQLNSIVKSRKRYGAQSRWDQETSVGDDGAKVEESNYRVHANESSTAKNLTLGNDQDLGEIHQSESVETVNATGNESVGSELIHNQVRTDDQQGLVDESAMSLDDGDHSDNSSLHSGALAPALKAPQEP